MKFWACKCCAEKDSRIASLRSEIEFLRTLVRRPEHHNASLPVVTLEADAVLSAQDEQTFVEVAPESEEARDIELERDRLLAGTY